MDIRKKEAIRYLGYGKNTVDDKTIQLIDESFLELEQIADERMIYQFFEVFFEEDNAIQIGCLKIKSTSLCRNLEGCTGVVLMGATLGTETDRKIRQYEIVDLPRAVVFGACAAAYLEEFCDRKQNSIQKELGKEVVLRPRFSPGYGDFSLEHQGDILRMLDAQKKIGLTLTNAKMMTPSKSITAVIGVYDK